MLMHIYRLCPHAYTKSTVWTPSRSCISSWISALSQRNYNCPTAVETTSATNHAKHRKKIKSIGDGAEWWWLCASRMSSLGNDLELKKIEALAGILWVSKTPSQVALKRHNVQDTVMCKTHELDEDGVTGRGVIRGKRKTQQTSWWHWHPILFPFDSWPTLDLVYCSLIS